MIWLTEVSVDAMNQRSADTLAAHLNIEFIEIGDDYLKAQMPIMDQVKQPLGIMHGGASCVLAETVGSTAANYCVDQSTHYCVGLVINTNHLRAIRQGVVVATAKPYHLGRSTQVWTIDIHDEQQRLISVNRLTMSVLSR